MVAKWERGRKSRASRLFLSCDRSTTENTETAFYRRERRERRGFIGNSSRGYSLDRQGVLNP